MVTATSHTDLVKKADKVANLAYWLFILMVASFVAGLFFKVPIEVLQEVFAVIVLAAWLVSIVELRLLRRAIKMRD